MESNDPQNACLVEETTTLIFDAAVTARQKRTEIRRFKKISCLPASPRSLNVIHQGVFKRSRPLNSSICDMCYHGDVGKGEDDNGFPTSKSKLAVDHELSLASGILAEIKGPQVFGQAYTASNSALLRGSGLVRSKSFPPEGWQTSSCIVHISKTRRGSSATGVGGRFVTVVSDEHGSTLKEASSRFSSWTAEVTSTIHLADSQHHFEEGQQRKQKQKMGIMVEIPMRAKSSAPMAGQSAGGSVPDLNLNTVVYDKKTDITPSEDLRTPSSKASQVDTDMLDPAEKTTSLSHAEGSFPSASVDSSTHTIQLSSGKCPPCAKLMICGRRREMEDTAVIVLSFAQLPCSAGTVGKGDTKLQELHFAAVYDGHGGSQASNYCAERLHHALSEGIASSSISEDIKDDSEWRKVMSSCFLKMDKEVGGICPNGACDDVDSSATCCADTIAPENVGTTAVVAVVSPSQIVIANCGDSRAVLSRGGKAIPLSKDHKPERDDETSRIEAAGGRVIYWDGYRVGGLLALSRAIGDRYLKRYVISEPDVLCLQRTEEDECLILASDGLWDVISNDTACDVARRCLASARRKSERRTSSPGEDAACAAVAAVLVKLAYGRGSKDNITVVVIDLRSRQK